MHAHESVESQMTEPELQHIVPQVYLKQFAREGLVVYDKTRDINEQVADPTVGEVESLAAEPHFYTLFREDGPDYSMERTLSRIENYYKALQKPLRSRKPLSADQFLTLSLLAAVQDARSAGTRSVFVEPMRQIRDEIVSSHCAADSSLSEEELHSRADEIIRRDVVGDSDMLLTPENISLQGMPTSMRFNFDLLRHMYKTIVYTKAQDFLTSDAPVAWVDPAQYPRDKFGPFYRWAGFTEVTYPLSRECCLLMAWHPMAPVTTASEVLVGAINARTAQYADRHIFAPNRNNESERRGHARDMLGRGKCIGLPLSMILDGVEVDLRDAVRQELAEVYQRCLKGLGIDWDWARTENLKLAERFKKIVTESPFAARFSEGEPKH
jgi:uncharacterized protein DUF4238